MAQTFHKSRSLGFRLLKAGGFVILVGGLVPSIFSTPASAVGTASVLILQDPLPNPSGLPSNACSITAGSTNQPCPTITAYAAGGNYTPATPSPINAARSDPGNAANPIDVWNHCRYVNNISSGTSIFVPFRTALEWQAFVNNAPASVVNLATCARPLTPTSAIPADTNSADSNYCGSPVAQGAPSPLPYAATGQTETSTQNYTCTCTSGATWTETATATLTAGVSPDTQNPSSGWTWPPSSIAYSGTVPANCDSPTKGVCGSDNGQSFGALPSDDANLCSTGTVANFTGGTSGPWSWTCTVSGTTASCAASQTPASVGNDSACGQAFLSRIGSPVTNPGLGLGQQYPVCAFDFPAGGWEQVSTQTYSNSYGADLGTVVGSCTYTCDNNGSWNQSGSCTCQWSNLAAGWQ